MPSFKINRNKNCYYDFRIGKSENIIDFAILFHIYSVGEFLKIIQDDFYFHRQPILIPAKENEEGSIKILYSKTISSLVLIRHLRKRNIFLSIAEKYPMNFLREITAQRILPQSKTKVKK